MIGTKEVKDAGNDQELRVIFDSLFHPIAPTLRIRQQKKVSEPFLPWYLMQVYEDTTQLETVAWQHIGIDQEDNNRSYHSARLNRPGMEVTKNSNDESPNRLFAKYPKVGETVVDEITTGIWSEVPLALYSDIEHTLPRSDERSLKQLLHQLDSIDTDSATANDEEIRLGNIVIVWNVLQHFYPYFDVIGTDWDQQLKITLQESLKDKNEEDFYHTLRKMLASVRDGHIWLNHPSFRYSGVFPFTVDWIEGKIVVTRSIHQEIKPGDIIQSVNGKTATEIVQSRMKLVSGSQQLAQFCVLRRFGLGEEESMVKVKVNQNGTLREYMVERSSMSSNQMLYESDKPKIYEIEDNIFYVDLNRASMEEIEKKLEQIAGARGVIFDLRGYPNSNHKIISHLLSVPDTSDRWMKKPQIIYPDQEDIAGYEKHGWFLQPSKPHIEGNVAFITDGRAISYAESVMSFVEHYELGEIVGQPTAGTNGSVNRITLPGGYSFRFTGMKVAKHDGSQHHLVGIQPTVPVEKTIVGIRKGQDEYLEKAIEVVQQGAGNKE